MTAAIAAAAEIIRAAFGVLDELRADHPAEVARVYEQVIAHVRSSVPASMPLGDLGPPTEPIRDPRGEGFKP